MFWNLFKKKVKKKDYEYIVDITKPPIPPPCRTIYDGVFSRGETKYSKQRTLDWSDYIKEYGNTRK